MQDHFGVRVGFEAMAARFQFGPQLDVIEDLAVVDDPQRAVLVRDRLLARGEIENAQTGITQANVLVAVDAELIRAAVAYHRQHLAQSQLLDGALRCQVECSNDSAHYFSPVFLILPDDVLGSSSRNSTNLGIM